jgi:signal transduction histidine kinase
MVDTWRYNIAVAPLRDDSFNGHKSHIKYLDYSMCGLAQVLSNVPAYAGSVRHGETGLLVENSADSWYEAINALIESNVQIVERARMHVGNLAHALKTPLSVITNEARNARGPLARKVVEQASVMRHQVDFYLDRARMAAGPRALGAVTDVPAVVAPHERAMRRIHTPRDNLQLISPVGERRSRVFMVAGSYGHYLPVARGI